MEEAMIRWCLDENGRDEFFFLVQIFFLQVNEVIKNFGPPNVWGPKLWVATTSNFYFYNHGQLMHKNGKSNGLLSNQIIMVWAHPLSTV
jgi:hypothetical protein